MVFRRLARLPLGSLAALEAALRHNSFKEAALELGVTPAAISHHIKALEARLGSALFERLHRALKPTRTGRRLGGVVQKSFEAIEQVLSDLAIEGLVGGATSLSVSAAPSFAVKWLAPRLHRFQALHPKIDLQLEASETLVDLTHDRGIDVLIRYGLRPEDSRIQTTALWNGGRLVAVCAPHLGRRGTLKAPRDVLNHPLLGTAPPRPQTKRNAARAFGDSWEGWLAAAGLKASAYTRGPLFGSTQLALEAAAAGRGFALAPEQLVRDDIRRGVLLQPFDISLPDPFSYWLAVRRDRAGEARIRAFRSWILVAAR